ncbi:MAG: disulfide bond formation protein B [Burkholderiales bacterium PBB5]|nr:MAG: disulfide bond formation protein B [Burkholderiales bacterium PBB5]
MLRARLLLLGVLVAAWGSVGFALYTQHVWGMLPCPWCVLQRLVFVLIGAAALLGLLLPGAGGRRLGAGLALPLALAGMGTALWQHFVAAASASCNLSMADRLMGYTGLDSRWPEVFAAYASCADAKVDLAGVPYEFWSLALFSALALAAWRVLSRPMA